MKSQTVLKCYLAVAGLAVFAAGFASTAAAGSATTGVVYVVQGLPGKVVDVQIDGRTVATGAKAADIVGPLTVASGQRKLTVRSGGSVMLERMFTVDPDGNADLVVHRPASPSGAPVVTSFDNDLTAVPADKTSLTVAHTAAVPPADIKVNGKVLFSNVANGESLHVVVPAATYTVQIVPTGLSAPSILGPAALTLKGGSLTNVYAIGEPKSGTMNVVVHVVGLSDAGTEKPSKVNTGTGGQAAALGLTWPL
jgi:hypothetical protein